MNGIKIKKDYFKEIEELVSKGGHRKIHRIYAYTRIREN